VIKKTGFRTIYVGLNASIPPFNDRRVREAVAYAIDVKGLQRGVLSGVGQVGGGFESPVIGGAKEFPPRPHDPAKSRKLLAEAGFPSGFATSFYVPTGRYLMDRQLGEAIQAQLAEVGIKAKIESPEWGPSPRSWTTRKARCSSWAKAARPETSISPSRSPR
jgi:ABC-type transport system substrate-binding protein